MKIGEVANETGLSISNIRFYEKKGLLVPSRNEESGYRDYTAEDVNRLKTILLYRKMGLPIETIYLVFQGSITLDYRRMWYFDRRYIETNKNNIRI